MIVIDKLCYQSKLRYENAGEKFAFAVLTLLILSLIHISLDKLYQSSYAR